MRFANVRVAPISGIGSFLPRYNARHLGVRKAFALALAASPAAIYFPPGTYTDGLTALSNLEILLDVTADKVIYFVGDGPDLSILQFGPNQPTFRYTGIGIRAGATVVFDGIQIKGPADASDGGVQNGILNKQTDGISLLADNLSKTTKVVLRNSIVSGKFYAGIITASGSVGSNTTYHLEIEDSQASAFVQCLSFFAPDQKGHYVHVTGNSKFLGSGVPDSMSNQGGHLCYIHPHINTWMEGTYFDYLGNAGNLTGAGDIIIGGYQVQFNGSPTTKSDYCRIINPVSGTHNGGRGFQTQGNGAECEFRGGTGTASLVGGPDDGVYNGGIDLRGPATISGFTFERGVGIGRIGGTPTSDRLTLDGCKFNNDDSTQQPALNGSLLGIIRVSNSFFLGNTYMDAGDDATSVIVDNVLFDTLSGTDVDSQLILRPSSGQRVDVTGGTKFRGAPNSAAIQINALSATAIAVNIDASIDITAPAVAVQWDGSGASGLIHGRFPSLAAGLYPKRTAGALVQQFQFTPGLKTTPIASAASMLIPETAYDTFHISGTTTIDTVLLGFSLESGRVTDMMCGYMRWIHDSTAATSAAGNLVPLTTAARVAGSISTWQRNQTLGKWVEVGFAGSDEEALVFSMYGL